MWPEFGTSVQRVLLPMSPSPAVWWLFGRWNASERVSKLCSRNSAQCGWGTTHTHKQVLQSGVTESVGKQNERMICVYVATQAYFFSLTRCLSGFQASSRFSPLFIIAHRIKSWTLVFFSPFFILCLIPFPLYVMASTVTSPCFLSWCWSCVQLVSLQSVTRFEVHSPLASSHFSFFL